MIVSFTISKQRSGNSIFGLAIYVIIVLPLQNYPSVSSLIIQRNSAYGLFKWDYDIQVFPENTATTWRGKEDLELQLFTAHG
jgi:hypothetical protein